MNLTTDDSDLTDLELLAVATRDAMAAHAAGLVIGPPLDEVGLLRAARRARRADAAQRTRPHPAVRGGAA